MLDLWHDEDLREPLVRRQGSQVSMRVATQWVPRDTHRDSKGQRSSLLPLETRPDFPGESGMHGRHCPELASNFRRYLELTGCGQGHRASSSRFNWREDTY